MSAVVTAPMWLSHDVSFLDLIHREVYMLLNQKNLYILRKNSLKNPKPKKINIPKIQTIFYPNLFIGSRN